MRKPVKTISIVLNVLFFCIVYNPFFIYSRVATIPYGCRDNLFQILTYILSHFDPQFLPVPIRLHSSKVLANPIMQTR
jgi:hypothetical protein